VAGLGNSVAITRMRDGPPREIEVRLIAAPEDPPRNGLRTSPRAAIPGLELANINPAVLAEFGLPLSTGGVVITDPGAAGPRAGLARGDVIRAIDGVALTDTAQADALLRKASGRLTLDVQRGDQRRVLRFRL
jgi:S1-C subfamily serine protease